MTISKIAPTLHHRVSALEQRADKHDEMAAKIGEIYDAWTKLKNINWFVVKIGSVAAGGLGLIAIVSTIITNAAHLTGH